MGTSAGRSGSFRVGACSTVGDPQCAPLYSNTGRGTRVPGPVRHLQLGTTDRNPRCTCLIGPAARDMLRTFAGGVERPLQPTPSVDSTWSQRHQEPGTMQRKWMIALSSMFAFSVMLAGISLADDEEGPLKQLMEKIQAKSTVIKKAYRNPVTFKKSQKDVAPAAADLIKLSKEARGMWKEAAKKAKGVKDVEKDWVELCDAFTKEAQKSHAEFSKPAVTQ